MRKKFRVTAIAQFVMLALLLSAFPAQALASVPGSRQIIASSRVAKQSSAPQPKSVEAPEVTASEGVWDPIDPAAVQYSDGAWAVAYHDASNPTNLFFRRSLGTVEPVYWKDSVTIDSGADMPAMVLVGSTTALFYRKIVGTVKQAIVRTSSDGGLTWSAPTQLTNEAVDVYQIQATTAGGVTYVFWSRSDTSGTLLYRSSSDLATWSTTSGVGQPVGPLENGTAPYFDLKMLASGSWALTWLNVSIIPDLPNQAYNTNFPVVWFASSSSLASTSWSNKKELSVFQAFGQRNVKAVSLAQDSSGTLALAYASDRWPSDHYIFQRTSSDGGATWANNDLLGYEPTRVRDGSQAVYAENPQLVVGSSGTIRAFWDQEALRLPSLGLIDGYVRQLFRRDFPAGPIVQLSVAKELLSKCGPCVPSGAFVADPVNANTGQFTLPEADIEIGGLGPGLSFSRTYNSTRLLDSPVGFGWTNNLDTHLSSYPSGDVIILDGSGRSDLYTPAAGGGFTPPPGQFSTLVKNGNGTFWLTQTNKVRQTFSAAGLLVAVADRNDNTISLAYNGNETLASVTDPGGRSLTFSYSGTHISAVTDPLGRTVSNGYNAAGDLTTVTDKRGKVWTYTYNAGHQMLTKVDPNNHTVLTNTYTPFGKVLTQTDAKGGVTSFEYTGAGTTEVRDPRGSYTKYLYDEKYRTIRTYDPNNAQILYFYDDRDNLIRTDDYRSGTLNSTKFTHDAMGNVLTETDGLDHVWTKTYNSFNDVLTDKNPLNRTSTYTYNTAGNLTSVKNAKNETTNLSPNSKGQITAVTDARGKTTTFGYDAYGNQSALTNAVSKTWISTYDLASRKTSATDPLNHTTAYVHNPNDQVTSVTDARGKVTGTSYDNVGNRLTVTDPNSKLTTFAYDEKNRLTSVTDAAGKVTSYTYDANDNRAGTTDANGHVRSYTYNQNNDQTTETDAIGKTTTWLYNGVRNMTRRTDAKGVVTNYRYDEVNRLTSVTTDSAPTNDVTYTYNNANVRVSMVDSTGTTSYVPDELDRLSSVKFPANKTVSYLYDPAGNRSRLTYPDGKVVNYTYDDAGRMATVTDWANQVTSYGYDDAGRLTTTTLPNGVTQTNTYNDADQLATIGAKKGTTTLTGLTYTLDNAGRRTAVQDLSGNETYSYDNLYRITGVIYPDGTTQAYSYDFAGNRLTKTQGSTTTNYSYDDADRMTAAGGVAYGYDDNGNQTTRGSDTFGWDPEDRLSSANVGGTAVTYAYRGDDLRHSKTVGATTTTYLWDLASDLPVVLQDGTTTYVYGLGLISQGLSTTTYLFLNLVPTTTTVHSWFLTDGLGSTVALTNSAGAITATHKYDVFGATRATTGTGSTQFKFAGQQDDPTLGYQYLRARYYDPAIGRFISKDPFGGFAEIPQSQTSYLYAHNDPVNLDDPTGEVVPVVVGGGYLLLAAASAAGIATLGMEENRLALERSATDACRRTGNAIKGLYARITSPAAGRLPDLTGKSPQDAADTLGSSGFELGRTSPNGYQTWRNPDGSKVTIKPNGEVTRNGPKVTPKGGGKKYHPRYGPDGKVTQEHTTGEALKQ